MKKILFGVEVMKESKQKYKKEIGARIRESRTEMGISLEELAERVGITAGFLGLIERGNRCTTAQRLNDLAQILGITPNYLLQGEVDESHSRKDKLLHKLMGSITEENSGMYNKIFAQLSGYHLNETETKELCDFLKAALRILQEKK